VVLVQDFLGIDGGEGAGGRDSGAGGGKSVKRDERYGNCDCELMKGILNGKKHRTIVHGIGWRMNETVKACKISLVLQYRCHKQPGSKPGAAASRDGSRSGVMRTCSIARLFCRWRWRSWLDRFRTLLLR